MTAWQMVNINTGAVEGPKFIEIAVAEAIWIISLPTSVALGDTISGPTMPSNCFLSQVRIDTQQLDTGNLMLFQLGYAGAPGAFITSSSAMQTGSVATPNVPLVTGFNQLAAGLNTTMLITITRAAAVPVAGKVIMSLTYTATP